jgi:hypothetical protein
MAGQSARKWPWRRIGVGAGLLVIAGLVIAYVSLRPYGVTGTTYLAKQFCSCLFVAGRSEASCRDDFQPDISSFTVSIDRARSRVGAGLALFSSTSRYRPGLGCSIER